MDTVIGKKGMQTSQEFVADDLHIVIITFSKFYETSFPDAVG